CKPTPHPSTYSDGRPHTSAGRAFRPAPSSISRPGPVRTRAHANTQRTACPRSRVGRLFDGEAGGGGLAAGLALPMVPDLAAFDELRGLGCDHPVAAMGATRGRGESADSGELRRTALKQHISASSSLLLPREREHE